MMSIRSISIKVIALLILLVGLNMLYMNTLWKKDLDKEADMLLELLNKQDTCDILYFGESSNFTPDSFELCKKYISELTAEYYPSLRLASVDRPAMHAGIYLSVIKNIPATAKVKTLIVTMNLRSFGANWIHSKLETPLQKSNVMYQLYPPLVNRFMLSLNCYEKKNEVERDADMKKQWVNEPFHFPYPFKYKTVIEWDKAVGEGSFLNPDGSWDMLKIGLATSYIKTYGFQINTETNPRIKDFDEIVAVAKQKKLNIVFNLLAENVAYADSLVGKDLVFLMQQNKQLLIDRYTQKGALVVDNFEVVRGKDFIDQRWTTEHYKERGRRTIAKNVAEELKKIYPSQFVEQLKNQSN